MQKVLKQIVSSRVIRVSAVMLSLYALLGFLLLPYLIEQYVPTYAAETLQRQASVGKVRFNPFLFKVEVSDFSLKEADSKPIAAFRGLLIDFETASLLHWAWTFADVRCVGLDLHVDKQPDGRSNLDRLAESFPPSETPDADAAGDVVQMLLSSVALVDGAITYSDNSVKSPASATLKPLNLTLLDVTTLPDRNGSYMLKAELQNGGAATLKGKLTLHPLSAVGSLDIQGFPLATAWNFYRDDLRLAEPQGTVGLNLGYSYADAGAAANAGTRLELHAIQLQAAGLDLRQPNAQQPLLTLNSLAIKDAEFNLTQRALTLPSIELRDGRVNVAIAADGVSNWQTLTIENHTTPPDKAPAASAPDLAPPSPWRIKLDAAQLANIAVQVSDLTRATPLVLDVGQFAAGFNVDMSIGAEATTATANISTINLSEVALKPVGETDPLATLSALNVDGAKVNTGSREINVSQVLLRELNTRVERDAQGTSRVLTALGIATDAAPEKKPAVAESESAWRYKLDTLQLEASRAEYAHLSLKPVLAYSLEDITATLKNISNDVQTPVSFDASLRVKQGGTLVAKGDFAPDGSNAKVDLQLNHLTMEPLRALLAQQAALELLAGDFSATAALGYTANETGPALTITGTASIADLLIDESVGNDRFLAWKLLTADGLNYESGSASGSPSGLEQLSIKEMHLLEPGAKLLIYKDRSTNISRVFEQGSDDAAVPAADKVTTAQDSKDAARPFPVTIARLRVDKGVVDYSDQSLVLPFAAQIHGFHGAVNGISSDPESRAQIEFDGRVEKYGQAKVRGALSPFDPKRFTDIRTQFINIDMPPFSPYSATFAGRKIANGKLSLDLEYKIKDGVLAGDNKILLDKFTLGEPVDSPDALDLPLDLAVALLTDAQGRIDIAVPVQGNMNSPTFALGGVIGQAVTRMLTKIVTAPFSVLGKLLGGGDAQSNLIAFDPGSTHLQPPQQEKLVGVGKALGERPQLSVSVGGRYAPQQDGEALRSAHVRRALAAELDVKLAADDELGPVAFEQAQTQRALEKLLETRAGDKAVDAFQIEFEKQAARSIERVNPVLALLGKESPDHEFYTALFERLVNLQPLPEAELKALAQQRAEIVAHALVNDAGVDARRVSVGKVEIAKHASGETVETVLSLGVQGTEK